MLARVRAWRAEWVVWALALAYAIFFATLTIQRHNAFQSTDFELGNLSQIAWNNLHGAPFVMTNPEGMQPENSLGIHVWPILLPVSLIYLVWPDPRALLVLQAVVVALGAWPLFWLARRALAGEQASGSGHAENPASRAAGLQQIARGPAGPNVLALIFVFAYLMLPALQAANRFDFHEIVLAPTLLLMAFWRLENAQWGQFALWAGLAMACKEDVALLVLMMGLYTLIARRRFWPGLITVAVSAAWFWVAAGVILPHFDVAGASPLGYRYSHLGDSLGEIALTFVTRPGFVLRSLATAENLAYVRDLLTPVAFLSFLAPQVLVLALPALLENLLSLKVQMHQLEGFQYSVTLLPFVAVSAAYGAGWLIRRLRRYRAMPYALALAVMAATLIYHYGHGETPLARDFRRPQVTEHHRLGMAMAQRVPASAAASALPRLFPHISTRRYVYAVNHWDGSELVRVEGADYVWLDVTNFWPLHPNDLKAGAERLLADQFGVVEAADGWLLLRRGAVEKELPSAFFDFARATNEQPLYPLQLQFLLDGQPVLECLGFDLRAAADGWQLTFFWRALSPLPEGLRLYPFYLNDSTSQVLEDTTLRPMVASVWYPPSAWQVGEVIRTETLPWLVGDDFAVGLGVVQGDDWAAVGQRLPIRVESSTTIVRLFEGNTWARLLGMQDGKPKPELRTFALPSPPHPLDADLGGQVRLLGYDLERDRTPRIEPSSFHLTLYWQAQQRMTTSYTVFVQLLDPAGRVVSQADGLPQDGGYPTIWWLPGEVVADSYALEPAAEAGQDITHRLIVGLYDAATGARLPVSGTGSDFVELTAVQP